MSSALAKHAYNNLGAQIVARFLIESESNDSITITLSLWYHGPLYVPTSSSTSPSIMGSAITVHCFRAGEGYQRLFDLILTLPMTRKENT